MKNKETNQLENEFQEIQHLRIQTQNLLEKLLDASKKYQPSTIIQEKSKSDLSNVNKKSPTKQTSTWNTHQFKNLEHGIQSSNRSASKGTFKKTVPPFDLTDTQSKQKQYEAMNSRPTKEEVNELLARNDDYYDQIQAFRKMHPDVFFTRTFEELEFAEQYGFDAPVPSKINARHNISIEERHPEYQYTGFYQTNKDYSCLLPAEQPPIFEDVKYSLAEGNPPVKVSILDSHVEKIRDNYKRPSRTEFEPGDSMFIEDFTYRGYESYWYERKRYS